MASDLIAKSNEPRQRIPKLTVKETIPEDAAITTSLSQDLQQPPARSSVASSAFEQPPNSPPPKTSFASESAQLLSSSSASGTMNSKANGPLSKKKKKVLDFLSVREPSTKAWEQFAEAEREKAKSTGKIFPTQKLPDHVPKVNSKWDGLPESARQRHEIEKLKAAGLYSSSRVGTSYSKDEWAEDSGLPFAVQAKSFSSEDDRNLPTTTLESREPGYSQLEDLPELPDDVLVEADDNEISELDTSSSNIAARTIGESPDVASGELDSTLPGLVKVDESDLVSPMDDDASSNEDDEAAPEIPRKSSRRAKPVNFSRPLRKQTDDSIGYPTAERPQNS